MRYDEPRLVWTVCVLLLRDLLQSCAHGGRRIVEDMCYEITGVDPLLRACSSSTALTVVGLHTHIRTHRTSSDPAYL